MSDPAAKHCGLSIGNGRSETRTTGSEGQSCLQCGSPIGGRRRNGYCSDRCRMRTRRQSERAAVVAILEQLDLCVDELRRILVLPDNYRAV